MNEKGTQKGNRGGATPAENYQVTRERAERHLNSVSPGACFERSHQVKLNQVRSKTDPSWIENRLKRGDLLTLLQKLHLPECTSFSPTLLHGERENAHCHRQPVGALFLDGYL